MLSSDYEAMKFHEHRSRDLIREATEDRLAREVERFPKRSGFIILEFTALLGTLLINWGEKLKNLS